MDTGIRFQLTNLSLSQLLRAESVWDPRRLFPAFPVDSCYATCAAAQHAIDVFAFSYSMLMKLHVDSC